MAAAEGAVPAPGAGQAPADIAIVAGDANRELAQDVARLCSARLIPAVVTAFADGETRVRIEAEVSSLDLYIVQSTSAPTNDRLMSLALLADAARAAGARRITAVTPYFGYARQDVRKASGEPRSARLAARLLAAVGIDRIVVLELHSPALESAFDIPLVHLEADEVMLPAIRDWNIAGLVVVAPDAGALKRAQRYAMQLAAPLAVVAKSRPPPDVAIAPRSAALETHIRDSAAKLEEFHDRITSCRVTVEQTAQHHHQGRPFRVSIDLRVPGKEIVANRDHHEDVYVALRDAFDAVKRQLEETARLRRGDVKVHEAVQHGEVVRMFREEGHGFIRTADGRELYFSREDVVHPGFDQLESGAQVQFLEEPGAEGLQAKRVSVGKHQF